MNLISKILFFCLVLLVEVSQVSAAPRAKSSAKSDQENEINRAEIVEYRSKLEEVIAEKYRRRISTRIEDDAFNVGTQVVIELVKDEKNNPVAKQEESSLPSDITLGILENYTLPESTLTPAARPQLRIKKVEILVGLHPKLGKDYKAKFSTWLKASIKAEFQNLGSATITDLVEKPKVIEKKEPEQARPLNWEEKFGYFQNLIGFIVLAFFLVFGMIIAKRMPSKDTQEQLSVALRIQEMKNSQLQLGSQKPAAALGAPGEKNKNELQLSANLLFDNYRDHQRKVAFIALSSPEKIDQALDLWFDESEEGRKKIASLVDSVLTQYGINQLNEGVNPAEMEWHMPEKIRNDKDLPGVFRAFATLSLVDKTSILEKTYWDLLSLKTLSDKLMRPRFSSISQLPAAKIQKILSGQDAKVKSLTLLHLPLEKLNQVMSEMTFDEKKTTVIQAFSLTRVREKELELLDESLRFNVKKDESTQEGTIEVQSLIPNMLMSLKPTEELTLLKDIVSKLPDQGEYLKQNYPSLAFVMDWPEDKFKLLAGNATTQEALALIQMMPDISTKVLAALPSRTKMIVQDEIGKRQIDSAELDQHLEGLKYRLFKLVNDGQISLVQIFKSSANASPGKAA